jgi:ABC-2 type transport system ATP-binding protein
VSVTTPPPLVIDGLRKAYRKRPVLDGVTLSVQPGEAVALLGSNGAGKSTLLGCVTGDRLPDGGSVRVCGADPFSDPVSAARCMGVVPEHPFLYGELTVAEMLRFVAAARGMEAERETERLLELLGLAGAEGTLCRELSQGMGRKTAIIAALLHAPRVLLLDEALNGLDRTSAERLVGELDARRRDGVAILVSSHDLEFVGGWCGRGLLLQPGGVWSLLEGGSWDAWRRAPSLRGVAGDTGVA